MFRGAERLLNTSLRPKPAFYEISAFYEMPNSGKMNQNVVLLIMDAANVRLRVRKQRKYSPSAVQIGICYDAAVRLITRGKQFPIESRAGIRSQEIRLNAAQRAELGVLLGDVIECQLEGP